MLDLIKTYKSRGLNFCYLTGPFRGLGTGYNRDYVDQPDLKEGIIFILTDGLERFGMSRQQGFTCQTMHELGHYEAFKRGLDYRSELVAWDLAEEIYRSVFGSNVPDWWAWVRQEVTAKEQAFWARLEATMRESGELFSL